MFFLLLSDSLDMLDLICDYVLSRFTTVLLRELPAIQMVFDRQKKSAGVVC